MKALIAAAAMSATAAAAQPVPMMNAEDPVKLHAAMTEMGYAPEPLSLGTAPSTVITLRGISYFVILGGCTDAKACKTVMIGSRYTDVVNPPLDWVNKQNEQYDLLKVWVNPNGDLGYAVQAPAEGMTRRNFRALIDGLLNSGTQLGKDAIEAKLVSTP